MKEQCLYREGKLVGPFITPDTAEGKRAAEGGLSSREEEDLEEKEVENLLAELARLTESRKTEDQK